MPVLTDWTLKLTADDVLWAQGSDPAIIRKRSPRLVDIAEDALQLGSEYLRPAVAYDIFDIESVLHNKLKLSDKNTLKSPLVAEHLRSAEKVAVAVYTVGLELERHATELMNSEYSMGLALNGLGSTAVDALGTAFHKFLDGEIASDQIHTAVPISPGLEGWPTHEGQRQIAKLVDFSAIGVELNESATLFPLKSSTLIIGIGKDVSQDGTVCDYCAINDRCGYRSEFGQAH